MKKYTLSLLLFSSSLFASPQEHPFNTFSTEIGCLELYEADNQIFVEGLRNYRERGWRNSTLQATPEQKLCMLYYLWQKETGEYTDFPEEEGSCRNVWGTWQPFAKEAYLDICTGKVAY